MSDGSLKLKRLQVIRAVRIPRRWADEMSVADLD
jgi:hypothetical protein